MHRAGIGRAFDDRFGFALAQIFRRVGDEFRFAAGRAEIIRMAVVRGLVLGGMRIDRHAADRIEHAALSGSRVVVLAVIVHVGHRGLRSVLQTIPAGGL